MRPEQRAFRLFAVTSMLFSTGCEAVSSLRSTQSSAEGDPAMSSPLPAGTVFEPAESLASSTPTPFMPIELTPTIVWTATATETPEPYILSPDSPIRLDRKVPTTLTFTLDGKQEIVTFTPNKFNPEVVDFKELCQAGTVYGCTFSIDDRTFIFLDSGWFDKKKLAMEPFRDYAEGSIVLRTGEERTARLQVMEHTAVKIGQGESSWTGEIIVALYIPHENVEEFTGDLAKGPEVASRIYPEYADAIQKGIVFLEFCGWDMTLPAHQRYTASRYLLIIGESSQVDEATVFP